MSNYILTASGQLYHCDASESELYHYGVPGMKWGQRKASYASEKSSYKQAKKEFKAAKNLAHIFPISFPEEFAAASIREIHAGHLHHESEADIYGVMVRRLSTGGITDDWSNRQDFIGAHKRFMVFEWDLEGLRSIHYI